ncbi:MAG: hypothetical protein R2764_20195 [Bacteroidales bacterium]
MLFIASIFLIPISTSAQEKEKQKYSLKNPKGNFYVFWGYNRSAYAKSTIHLKSDTYDFTLYDMPEKVTVNNYLNPAYITVPQFNARVGFYITDKYVVSAGWDHTKYQTNEAVTTTISGTIDSSASEKYAGIYDNELITVYHDSLVKMEHSDGLNLIQFNFERHDLLITNKNENLGLSTILGAGLIFPMHWTNAKIFGIRNDDRPHFTGIGFSLFGGVKFFFFKRFFLQGLFQTGYLHMPGIVTTPKGGAERASQNIKYIQGMVVLGYSFRLFKF